MKVHQLEKSGDVISDSMIETSHPGKAAAASFVMGARH
jgi:hypothetical protein